MATRTKPSGTQPEPSGELATEPASSDQTQVRAGSEEEPRYFRVPHTESQQTATTMWMIVCDEGWRQSIVCAGMYEWAADWLLGLIGSQPFARDLRPD